MKNATEIAGVETEPPAKRADLASIWTDFPQQARFTKWKRAILESVAKGANSFLNGSIEPSDLIDRVIVHFSDYSQKF